MVKRLVCKLLVCLTTVMYTNGNYSTIEPIPDLDYSEEGGGLTVGRSDFTTVILPTAPLRNVPEDVKEFWGEQYIDISIVTVLEKEISEKLNISMIKIEESINRTTAFIERQVKIISESDWKERVESAPEYQMSLADELSVQWEELQNLFEGYDLFPADKGLVKNFNETAISSAGWPIQEFNKIIKYAHKEIHFRRKDLNKQMGRNLEPSSRRRYQAKKSTTVMRPE